jgi:deoxyribonuclease V
LKIRLNSRFSAKKAHITQLKLSQKVIHEDRLPKRIRYVGGVDVAYTRGTSIGAAVVLDSTSLEIVECKTTRVKTRFPYISSLLAFRENFPVCSSIRKLRVQPDVFLVDGHGIAHQYRLGFASHLGLVLDVPSIGVGKSHLCGEVQSFNQRRWAPILDGGEVIGAAVLTKPNRKAVYISVGHQVSLERAISIVLNCTRDYRIPEPIRRAHIAASIERTV